MLSDAEVGELRDVAESTLDDTCTITRPGTGPRPFDHGTGRYLDPPRVTVYAGPCRIQVRSVVANVARAGERQVVQLVAELQLPVAAHPAITAGSSAAVAVNDVVHIDTCRHDPALVGRAPTVTQRTGKTHATTRRFQLTEVSG
ncbi:DUF6093 family protein [Mumia sp. DW29H23]|uniref:DUF6093 family protein n=1 Tax=Mumia sp. DW29H23 TaxID=3421241 RepID=UPI003D692222